MRLFAALVPPVRVLEHAERALAGVRSGRAATLRWVPRENLHLTLAFYGDVPEGSVPDLTAGLAALAATSSAPDIWLRGAGAFAGRTLWLGLAGEVRGVQGLMGDARDLLTDETDDGPPRPHVTVARTGRRSRDLDAAVLADTVRALAVYRGPAWRPAAITLLSSHLGEGQGGAPRYEVEASHPLG